jgi:hypothetical protein
MPKYRFFFHYNKPASRAAGAARLSVHFRDVCHIVNGIVCRVPCESKIRKRQPHCVMVGNATDVRILPDGRAEIYIDRNTKN